MLRITAVRCGDWISRTIFYPDTSLKNSPSKVTKKKIISRQKWERFELMKTFEFLDNLFINIKQLK